MKYVWFLATELTDFNERFLVDAKARPQPVSRP